MKRSAGLFAWAAAVAVFAAAGQEVPRLQSSEPRAFGYQVGDLVARRVSVALPAGWQLDARSLPQPGARGQALELRRVESGSTSRSSGRQLEIDLEYQVFLSPPVVRTLEIPAFKLVLKGPTRSAELLVEAWPVTVAPLVPVEVSPRRGLGELRPDQEPPLVATAALATRLMVDAALAALLIGALVCARLGAFWRAARNRPFAQAWRQLRRLGDGASDAQWREACRQVHAALNRSAGEVVFESGLARFVAAQPRFGAVEGDLEIFLKRSRNAFFGGVARQPGDVQWLIASCRRLRDAERGRL
jgi:mxaA protein